MIEKKGFVNWLLKRSKERLLHVGIFITPGKDDSLLLPTERFILQVKWIHSNERVPKQLATFFKYQKGQVAKLKS